jgi:oxygen-independent coproporphyrinogen III oxidase
MIDDELLLKHDSMVPRYTSYPTAPHFNEAVNGNVYADWLREIGRDQPLSLYFHVPFCDTMCWFCGCQTKVVNRYQPVASYLEILHREIDQIADILVTRRPVAHIHWGGGSPTIVESDDFRAVMARLDQRFEFLETAEIAVEIDPRGFTREHARALTETGVNRASIGIQDFEPDVQKAVNRVQPYEETRDVVEALREFGVSGISFDLLYGLPYQTVETVLKTIDQAVGLGPDRVSLFGYAHVPWMRAHQQMINEDLLPDGKARLALYRAAAGRLAEHGYIAIGIDHFAKLSDPMGQAAYNGNLQRNFQGYTTDEAEVLIGFGASAIGSLPQGYVQNAPLVPDYRKSVEAGELPIVKGIAVSNDDLLRRRVIERLMCDLKVDLAVEAEAFGSKPEVFDQNLSDLTPLKVDGLVTVDGYQVVVPEGARLAVRAVCAVFDDYLGQGAGRHSRAI